MDYFPELQGIHKCVLPLFKYGIDFYTFALLNDMRDIIISTVRYGCRKVGNLQGSRAYFSLPMERETMVGKLQEPLP